MHSFRYRQYGLTIIELMVALLISSILIGGAISLFLATSKTRKTSQHMNKVATEARAFTNLFAHDIRMAGFTGRCESIKKPRLMWKGTHNTLIIRYCKNGSVAKVKYLFKQPINKPKNKCSGSGNAGNGVCYFEFKKGKKPLLGGFNNIHIWFGEEKSGGFQYKNVTKIKGKVIPNFRDVKTVRLQFTILGTSLSNHQLNHGNYVKPTFDFTVAIRKNNL